jgi:hypothetical protein
MVAMFFKRVAKHFANEVAVVTPNGKLLSASLTEGLQKWHALPEAERRHLDDLGPDDAALTPEPPAQGLVLAVYARAFDHEADDPLSVYKTAVARSKEPGRDHLWLTEAEWRSLVPAEACPGDRRPVPERIADRICRRCLIDLVRVGGNGGPRRPEEVLSRDLHLTVTEASPTAVRLRLDGSARLATHDQGSGARGKEPKVDEYRLLGYLSYDPARKAITRFDIVAYSETGHFDEIAGRVLPFGVAFEVAPGDRVPPWSFGKDYFQ